MVRRAELAQGMFTRGVLLDVPKFRGEAYVPWGKPVTGAELAQVAESQGVTVQPGDALLVYSGREAHDRGEPLPVGRRRYPEAGPAHELPPVPTRE